MKAHSLRLRLLLGAALWIGLALLLAGLAIGYMFVQNVEQAMRADLRASQNRVIALLEPGEGAPQLSQALADPRYDTPFGGLYWQISKTGSGATSRSRSLWDFELSPDAGAFGDGQNHFITLPGPNQQNLSALVRQVVFTTGDTQSAYLITVAENRASLDASIRQFGRDLVAALCILGLVLMIAALLQVRLGLTPLKAIRAGIEAIRHGKRDKLPETYPAEVLPLVASVNDLLASQEKSMQFARARAADLAHGLKTPLAVLATTADKLRHKGDSETAEMIEQMTREMADRVDYQLRLSRLRMRDHTHVYSTQLNKALSRTISVLEKTREGEKLHFSFVAEEVIAVDIDPHDLIELIGVLLENAAKWAQSSVTITARRTKTHAEVVIADDGPGLSAAQIAALGARGKRLDESKKGSGLGLAIAREIVELNAGRLGFGTREGGGLEVRLELPLAR